MSFQDLIAPIAATLAQLLPLSAVLRTWGAASLARRWIAIWFLIFFISDLCQIALLLTRGPNLWFFSYIEPVEDAVLLWALSYWQPRPVMRLAVRVSIPLFIGTIVGITILAGETTTFGTFSGPFRSVILMACTAYTLIANLNDTPERVWEKDWLWTTLGILLYFGLLAATDPILAAMGRSDLQSMRRVHIVRDVGDIISFPLVWRSRRCPIPTRSSGST